MKTLDEVIDALQYWDTCDEYPESFYDFEVTRDALHYLKAFRDAKDALDTERDRYVEAVKNCEQAENKYKLMQKAAGDALWQMSSDDNPALTWDELRTMEGKPVWVEFEKHGSHWLIITDVKQNGVVGRGMYGENVPLYQDSIGQTWRAYRKERE